MTLFGPGPGPARQGEGKSYHIVVRVDHQHGTWKEYIPGFMGQGGCWNLCSRVNSCTPLQGLITQVSLEILATETPGGRVAGKRSECNVHHASAALLRKSSSSRTFLLERIYFTSLSKMSPSIFSSVWGLLTFNQSTGLYTRKAYVTDMLLSSKILRWQLSWISIWVHIAFINYFLFFLFPCPHHFPHNLNKVFLSRCICTKCILFHIFVFFLFLYTYSKNIRICKVYSCFMSCSLLHMSFQ